MTWVDLEISLHHSTGGDCMAHGFMRQGRKTHRRPRVATHQTRERPSAVPTCQDGQRAGCTKAHACLWGAGSARARPVSQGKKARTLVRLTDGHDAAGLQDRERSRACILQAVSRHTPHARVWIIPGSQVGIDHGTTSQEMARPRTRGPPPHALGAASGARVGHLDHTVDVLSRHTPS